MKIVILDGYTANPGDYSWKELNSFGEVEIYDRTSRDEVIARAKDADMVLTNKVVLKGETLAQLPQLKYIGILATGYNIIDVDETRTGHRGDKRSCIQHRQRCADDVCPCAEHHQPY